MSTQKAEGARYALLAFVIWGLLPAFWHLLGEVPPLTILFNRIVWSFVFCTLVLAIKNRKQAIHWRYSKREWIINFLVAALLSSNWLVYITAVNSGKILEASLGYFINPLVNILLGCVFLKESLQKHHKIAAVFSLIGVAMIALQSHSIPWVALYLGFTFSVYGIVRKQLHQSGIKGGQLETFLMLPLVGLYLFTQSQSLLVSDPHLNLWLVLSGVVTALPLICFTEAAKRLPYYMMGFFQFVTPSLMFVIGVLYGEKAHSYKLLGFMFIWAGSMVLLVRTAQIKRRNKALGR